MYSELLRVSLNKQFISKYNVPELSALCCFTLKAVDMRDNSVLQKSGRLYVCFLDSLRHDEMKHAIRFCSGICMSYFDTKNVIAMSWRDSVSLSNSPLIDTVDCNQNDKVNVQCPQNYIVLCKKESSDKHSKTSYNCIQEPEPFCCKGKFAQ